MAKTLQILTFPLLLLLVLSAYAPITHAASASDIRAALERELAELDAEAARAVEPNTETKTRPTFNISRENYDNPLIEIETSMGLIIIELFPNEAPVTVRNFLALAEGSKAFTDPQTGELVTRPFYDGLIFHRIVDGFMIQAGSPTGLGDGGPGYTFNDEINARSLGLDKMLVLDDDGYPHPLLGVSDQTDFQQKVLSPLYQEMNIDSPECIEANVDAIEARLRNMTVKQNLESLGYEYSERFISRNPVRGVLAMANSGPNSNGSQFFITLADTDWLTGRHTVFGKVRAGMNIVERISKVRVDAQSRPYRAISIISIKPFEN